MSKNNSNNHKQKWQVSNKRKSSMMKNKNHKSNKNQQKSIKMSNDLIYPFNRLIIIIKIINK
jgi:hypothetical protein